MALVLSDRTPAAYTHTKSQRDTPLPCGTADEVTAAIGGWVTRASRNQENQTVFFFCGHGVSSGESILLLRDYGAKSTGRFDGSA